MRRRLPWLPRQTPPHCPHSVFGTRITALCTGRTAFPRPLLHSTVATNSDARIAAGFVYERAPEPDEVEVPERYQRGGYHPVDLGDTVKDGRYTIVLKLGFGGYSTVWLARDSESGTYVTVKVCSADREADSAEASILERLRRHSFGHVGPAAQTLLDSFTLDGPNGSHQCLLTVLGMMSIREAQEASHKRLFTPDVARAITAHLIKAVYFLHETNGVVHGDIHPGNVLLRIPAGFHDLSAHDVYSKYDTPRLEPMVRVDRGPLGSGVPENLVVPGVAGKRSEDVRLDEARVFLSDFGESFIPPAPRTYSNSPISYRPPEARFLTGDQYLSFPGDLWSLACLVWDIMGVRPLFESWISSEDDVLADQVDLLGRLPRE